MTLFKEVLKDELFKMAILGFALTEAIALFALIFLPYLTSQDTLRKIG
jgi:F0F1-type ATP synthase membrane subunit c/vacuolar-type H+-ATPase subunit K